MMMMIRSEHSGVLARRPAILAGWRLPVLVAALILGLAGRIAYSSNAPFWFDETFTGVIASQPTFAGLLKWCLTELTGPAFYMPLWAWEKLAGNSDFALRLPSLILSLGTPLAILRWGNRDADLRLWWAVFVLLWVPIFAVAGEARPYPAIFALGIAQAVLFVRLLERPTTVRASLWVVVASLAVLCDYWSVVPALVQGIAFLAVHRLRALKSWPALVFLGPLLAWSWFHLPRVLAFAIGGSSGIAGMPLADLLDVPAMLFGVGVAGSFVLAAVALSLVLEVKRGVGGQRGTVTPELVLAACAVGSIALLLLLGLVRPGFVSRYATASIPSVLFALALWARWMMAREVRWVIAVAAMLFATAAGLLGAILFGTNKDERHLFELERPSAWLAERSPRRLVVFWDGSVSEASPDFALAEVGGFFFRRDHRRVDVTIARAAQNVDPNRAVLAVTPKGGEGAIVWFANETLPVSRRPRIDNYDPRFECRNFGGGVVTMTACRWRR